MAQSTVRLIVDAQNAIRGLQNTDRVTKTLAGNTNKLKGRLDRSSRSFRNNGNAARKASGGVKTFTRSIAPLLKALALVATARFVFVQTAELETQRKSLEVLTGSLSKTNQIIQELQDFGAVTPFTSSQLIEQTKRLKAFGFETEELVDTTKRLADISGATGADLEGISLAFGQIRAKGKLQREEELQLLERGVDITTELKKITKLEGEEFEAAMRAGKIGADKVNQAMINLTSEGGAFFGGATKQAETLNGKLSTLVDSVQTLARTVGEILGPAIKFVLDQATRAVQAIDRVFKRFQNIGKIGFGNVLEAENKAKADATRLTKLKFGDDVNLGMFGNKEAKNFLRERTLELTKQNIETEKLRQKDFEHNEEKKNALVETAQKGAEIKKIVEGTTTASKALKEETKEIKDSFAEIGETIGSQITDALVGAINGTKSLGESAKAIINDLANSLLRMGINSMLGGMFGGTGFGKFLGFANGGRPPVGRPSIVGEKGPELFVPSTSGTIIPNNQMGGTTNNIVVNVDASGSQVEGDENAGKTLGRLIATAVQSELVQQSRPGGLLG
ncbi:phage tape measure protein [uncultured Mediterranean phage uvMED]|nr:phage tape measure protein [uncultured Mediterranean phage uvMED]